MKTKTKTKTKAKQKTPAPAPVTQPRSRAEQKQLERDRMKALDRRALQFFVWDEDREAIRRYVDVKIAARKRQRHAAGLPTEPEHVGMA